MTIGDIITQECKQNNLPETHLSHIHLNAVQVGEIYHAGEV